MKFCGTDGQPHPGVPCARSVGPCAILSEADSFADACARNHASAAAIAGEIRRPYIFDCHVRLAAWAIPILLDGQPLPISILCGGVLLSEPDIALVRHVERLALEHDIEPVELVHSLESVPVLSRERVRAIADFLFEMSTTFVACAASPDSSDAAPPKPVRPVSQPSIVFPPLRGKETKKARLQRARTLERQSVETEILRFLRERKSDEAFGLLVELLGGTNEGERDEGIATNLNVAETFARLFRLLIEGARVSRSLYHKESTLLAEVLSRKKLIDSAGGLERSCRKFVAIAEEVTGGHRPRQIKTIQKFLERNFSKKLTLGNIGKKFGLREKALDALMRKHFGMSFTDYVSSLRVAEAKRLLESSDLSVSQIASRTGFSDQSYFTKVFKSRLGSTPTEFRSRQRS
jgi:AraC-like DNA-binding protein/ligand-binding sensor protein